MRERDQAWPAVPDNAEPESRGAPRFAVMMRAAKLIADDRQFLCVLRDASATGVRVRLFHAIPHHEKLEIELGSGQRISCNLVWAAEDHAGLRFANPTDVQRLIDDSKAPFPKRQLRLRISVGALVHSGGVSAPMEWCDISQQGACIRSTKHLLLHELVRIETPSLPTIYAKVRWRREPLYGLIFEHPFKLDELARMAAPLQGVPHEAPDAASPSPRFVV